MKDLDLDRLRRPLLRGDEVAGSGCVGITIPSLSADPEVLDLLLLDLAVFPVTEDRLKTKTHKHAMVYITAVHLDKCYVYSLCVAVKNELCGTLLSN